MSDPVTEKIADVAQDKGWWAIALAGLYFARQVWQGRTRRVLKKDEHADKHEDRKAARLAREHATLDRVIQSDRDRLRSLESRLEKMSDRLDTAEQKLADARVDIARLEVELKNKDATIAMLQSQLVETEAEAKANAAALEAKLADAIADANDLRERLRTSEAQVKLLVQSREDAAADDTPPDPDIA